MGTCRGRFSPKLVGPLEIKRAPPYVISARMLRRWVLASGDDFAGPVAAAERPEGAMGSRPRVGSFIVASKFRWLCTTAVHQKTLFRSSNVTAAAPEPLSDTIRGKYDLDVVGHYAPPDVLGSHLDTRKQTPVRLGEECKSHARDE